MISKGKLTLIGNMGNLEGIICTSLNTGSKLQADVSKDKTTYFRKVDNTQEV